MSTLALFMPAPAANAQPATRVIELFTSQGCSKCPPADRLMADLAREPATVVLSFPVNYWDYIGWKDTLASAMSTRRQHAYAAARGDGLVYTPQAIIDGMDAYPGADAPGILKAAKELRGDRSILSVSINLKDAYGTLDIEVGPGIMPLSKPAGVYVLRVARTKTVEIGRGENSGRSLTYTNVVRAMDRIGEWSGQPQHFALHELKAEDEGFVVLLQAGPSDKPGPILAAAKSANL